MSTNASFAGLAGVVAPTRFGFTCAWFALPGNPYVPGAAFLAAGLHAIAAMIALPVMTRTPKAAGAPNS